MDSQLQKALVDYEQGQTYDAGSKERKDFLNKGLAQFEGNVPRSTPDPVELT